MQQIKAFDHSTCFVAAGELWCASFYRVPEDLQGQATFLAKADGVIAGLAVADLVCSAKMQSFLLHLLQAGVFIHFTDLGLKACFCLC